jgi:hypothetical protein
MKNDEYIEQTSKTQTIIVIIVGLSLAAILAPYWFFQFIFPAMGLLLISSPAWIIYFIGKFIYTKIKNRKTP